jgi:hypothetical protein
MTNNEQGHPHPMEVILKRLANEQLTSEDIARMKAEPEIKGSIAFETAYMEASGEITLKIARHMEDGLHVFDMDSVKPGDNDYEATVKRHNDLTLGEANTVVQKLIDNKWVDAGYLPFPV